jgi:hypothetical protein
MEITGVRCNACGTRAWPDDPSWENWTTCVETCSARGSQVTRHFCPPCQKHRDESLQYPESHEQLDSGQMRVLRPSYVDPALRRALTPEPDLHADTRSGVPVSAPLPAPVSTSEPAAVVPWSGTPSPSEQRPIQPVIPVAPPSPRRPRPKGRRGVRAAATFLMVILYTLGFTDRDPRRPPIRRRVYADI